MNLIKSQSTCSGAGEPVSLHELAGVFPCLVTFPILWVCVSIVDGPVCRTSGHGRWGVCAVVVCWPLLGGRASTTGRLQHRPAGGGRGLHIHLHHITIHTGQAVRGRGMCTGRGGVADG